MASSPRIDELRKKFEENPRRYFAPLANEYRKVGEIDQAIAICREYLPQQPGHMSGHIVYGQALYEARQFEEGKAVFETALTLDPENLIALRHLGDIALIVGDAEAARGWYRRVLEADPRNEEIQAQLATLDQTAAGGAVPVPAAHAPPAAAATAAPAAAKPTPSSAPTVVLSAVPRPAAPSPPVAPTTAESPTAEIRLDTIPTHAPPPAPAEAAVEMTIGLEPTSFGAGTERSAEGPSLEIDTPGGGGERPRDGESLEIDTPVSESREAPPLDSFSLEGLETTSLGSEPPPSPPSAPPVAAAPADLVDLDFGTPPSPPAAPPHPAQAAAPEIAPLDLDLAAPSAPPTPAAVTPPAAASAGDDLPLLDLGDLPSAPTPTPAPPIEVPFEVAPVVEAPAFADVAPLQVAAEAQEFVAEPPQPVPEAGPFVTETMAELYLRQGHREEALRMYRALLDQRPNDASLRAKVAGLSPQQQPPPPPDPTGPTIREWLTVIATRRPGFRPEPPRQNGSNGSSPAAAGEGLVADGLAALFGNALVAPEDDGAAMSLALAFMDRNGYGDRGADEAAPIVGAPAHRAANDLSLDNVFGAQAPPPSPSSFSFDQFFSQRATSEHAADSGQPGGAGAESPGDVAHFTQWLEGLKQK